MKKYEELQKETAALFDDLFSMMGLKVGSKYIRVFEYPMTARAILRDLKSEKMVNFVGITSIIENTTNMFKKLELIK